MPAAPAGTGSPVMLEGIRVLDLTSLVPGAYATLLLADLGAEVLKLGRPFPEALPSLGGWADAALAALDRNKKSLALDLKDPRGAELARELALTCDVVIEGFRPGVAGRLGLGYRELAARSPRLVYCSLTGYGQAGPRAAAAGHDLNYLSVTGLLSLFAEPGRPPLIPPVLLADLAGGTIAALAVLAGLADRERSGRGSYLDVAMADVVASWLPRAAALTRADLPLAGQLPCYNVWATRDGGYVALAALEPRFWANFCRAVGREDLLPGQFSPAGEPVWAELAAIFRERTREEWARFAAGRDVCLTPVLDPAEGGAGGGLPFRVEGFQPPRRPPSRPGQHTREALAALGVTERELGDLAARGVVKLQD